MNNNNTGAQVVEVKLLSEGRTERMVLTGITSPADPGECDESTLALGVDGYCWAFNYGGTWVAGYWNRGYEDVGIALDDEGFLPTLTILLITYLKE